MNRFLLPVLLWAATACQVHAQRAERVATDKDRDLPVEKLLEAMAENIDGEVDYTLLLQELADLHEHPLSLNTAVREELEKFRFLSELQLAALWQYLEKHRPLYSIYELILIRGFDEETVRMLLPFITVKLYVEKRPVGVCDFFSYAKNELLLRYGQTLQTARGYRLNREDPTAGYLGDPFALYMRYRFRFRDRVSAGFTADKDAGEPFFRKAQRQGFDYYSAHLFIRNVSVFRQIALGDFKAQFGQGLVLWTGLAFGKSAFGTAIQRNGTGLSPYGSANENQFLRGAGVMIRPGKGVDITVFSSYKKLDGNLTVADDSSGNADRQVTSLPLFGMHRTETEIAKRRKISEWISGGNVSFRYRHFKIGVTALYSRLGARLVPPDKLYARYAFGGNELGNLGLHYAYVYRNFSFFGEGAWSSNGGWALVNGLQGAPVTFLSFALYHRYFSERYTAFYASPLSESGLRGGEHGFYFGMDCKPAAGISLSGYMDVFTFPWLRSQTNRPSAGYDLSAQATVRPARRVELSVRYRRRLKTQNWTGDLDSAGIKPVEDRETGRLRLHLDWETSARWRFRARLEWVRFRREAVLPQNGFLGYVDLTYSALRKPFVFTGRFEVFHTDGFASRLYAYESDVLYYYGFTPLYGKGVRCYLTARCPVLPQLDLWFKLANTSFLGQTTVGTGNAEIMGNNKTDIRVLLRVKF